MPILGSPDGETEGFREIFSCDLLLGGDNLLPMLVFCIIVVLTPITESCKEYMGALSMSVVSVSG